MCFSGLHLDNAEMDIDSIMCKSVHLPAARTLHNYQLISLTGNNRHEQKEKGPLVVIPYVAGMSKDIKSQNVN